MIKIGLLSDTHSHIDKNMVSFFSSCDEIWHAGDIGSTHVVNAFSPDQIVFRAVYGNIDDKEIQMMFPEYLFFELASCKILMLHIGGRPGNYTPKAKQLLTSLQPDVFICGHSHILRVIKDGVFNCLFINPGAAGHEGFHKERTMLRFDLSSGKISNLELIKLGKRGSTVTHL